MESNNLKKKISPRIKSPRKSPRTIKMKRLLDKEIKKELDKLKK
jgi:hypothetical protein